MIFNEYLIKTASMVVKSDSKYLFVAVWRFKMIFFERNSRSTLVQVDLWWRYKFTRTRKKFLVKIGKNWTAVELETCIRCLSVIILFLRTRMWKNHSMSWSRVMWIRLYRLQVRTIRVKPNLKPKAFFWMLTLKMLLDFILVCSVQFSTFLNVPELWRACLFNHNCLFFETRLWNSNLNGLNFAEFSHVFYHVRSNHVGVKSYFRVIKSE